jgi:hypothetical protein
MSLATEISTPCKNSNFDDRLAGQAAAFKPE